MNRFIDFILNRPRTSLALLAALTFAVASFAPRMQFDASIRAFILEDDPDYAYYQAYRDMFGQDEILAVAFEADDILTPANLALIRRLTERVEDVENVYDVRSLTNVEYMRSTEDSFEVVPLVPDEIPVDAASLEAIRHRALNNVIYSQDLISPDARKTSLIVTLASVGDGCRYHDEILAIERIVREEARRSGKALHVTGERFIDLRFLQYIHRDLKVFIPLTVLAIAVLLFAMFRNLRETVIGLVAVAACLMWVGGLIPLTGWEMNAVTAGLPSLVLCIAVTDVIHIIHRHREETARAADPRRALARSLREVAVPCFLTSLTTAIGFGSLVLNEVHLIKGFGVLAALGVGVCFPVCTVIVGALLRIWPARRAAATSSIGMGSRVPAALDAWAALLSRRRGRAIAAIALLFMLAVLGIAAVEIQLDRTQHLKRSSDVYQSLDFIDSNLAGTTELDICVDGSVRGIIKEPWVLRKLEDLAGFLRRQPEVDKVLFLNDFIKDMHRAFNLDAPAYYTLPGTREQVAELLLIYSFSGNRNELNKYVNYPYSRTRLSIRTSEHNSAGLDALIARTNGYLQRNFGGRLRARIGSSALANNNVFHYLVRGLILGLGAAVLVVGLVMCLAFRSVFTGLLSMVPNLLPVAACLGLMGACGIHLDIATAMIFSISLGIAVDDTIHLVARFRVELSRRGDREQALRAALRGVGPALIRTTIVIMGGFLVLCFASLKMNVTFGLLSAFIIFMTLLADLTVTPLCLLVLKPFGVGRAKAGRKAAPAPAEAAPELARSRM